MKRNTSVENLFESQLKEAGLNYKREFKALPHRKFSWDFAIIECNLLIEIHGGIWIGGGHSTGMGIKRDCIKLNLGCLAGFHQFNFIPEMVRSGEALEIVKEFVRHYGEHQRRSSGRPA